jgi:hypothetical protein
MKMPLHEMPMPPIIEIPDGAAQPIWRGSRLLWLESAAIIVKIKI